MEQIYLCKIQCKRSTTNQKENCDSESAAFAFDAYTV